MPDELAVWVWTLITNYDALTHTDKLHIFPEDAVTPGSKATFIQTEARLDKKILLDCFDYQLMTIFMVIKFKGVVYKRWAMGMMYCTILLHQ